MTAPTTRRAMGLGAVVFSANAGLLVLQLLAPKFLAPFVGSSLETWAAVIGVFLAGIATGNAVGGKWADRFPSPRLLVVVLLFGSLSAAWMVGVADLLHTYPWHRSLSLGMRIPVLAAVLCFPAGFFLSLLTPIAIRLGVSDVSQTGRAAGRVFALGTLGCLVGNYATGFFLLSWFPIDDVVWGVVGCLLVLGGVVVVGFRGPRSSAASRQNANAQARTSAISVRRGILVVFLCSFAAMALELAAVRMLAQVFGVSLFTWTGAIGVMLAGTACGNAWGGRSSTADGLAGGLVAAAVAVAGIVIVSILAVQTDFLAGTDVQIRILVWSLLLFFLPMFALGTVSPRVIRLTVPDVGHVGRVSGRMYAWSTAGAIAGTFATGFGLLAELGPVRTVLFASLLPAAAACLVAPVWKRPGLLYPLCVVCGAALAGLFALTPSGNEVTRETPYFTLHVRPAKDDRGDVIPNRWTLQLDSLVHSRVDVTDPTYLHYLHEQVQMELLGAIRERVPAPRVLVIGGGGYTFPRCAKTRIPSCTMDVVEIDPAVTAISYSHLGLDPALGIRSHHMDGRQFLAEHAPSAGYDLITLDAVNDLSVPAHLLTVEFNREVARTLAPGGVYLLTVIDTPAFGRIGKASLQTLRQVFPHVAVLSGADEWKPEEQSVLVLYASNEPYDPDAVRSATRRAGATKLFTMILPPEVVKRFFEDGNPVVLTDRFAPVDQMMIEVYRRRKLDR